MTCWNKQQLEQMLEDVVNELDLSDSAISEHGPMGTPPAQLVRLVLEQKNKTIRMLKAGMVDASQQVDTPDHEQSEFYCHACSKAGGADMPIYHLPPTCSDR